MKTARNTAAILSLLFLAATMLILAGRIIDRPPRQDTNSNPPHRRNLELQHLLLELVNQVRAEAGLSPVQLGDNNAAQLHAQDAATGCSGGHWDRHGLKPYMRHTLAGGHQPNSENWHNTTSCGNQSLWKMGEEPRELVQDAIKWLMESPGHRANLLNPQATHMRAGIAWGPETFAGDLQRGAALPTPRTPPWPDHRNSGTDCSASEAPPRTSPGSGTGKTWLP